MELTEFAGNNKEGICQYGIAEFPECDWASDTWQKYLPKVRGEERRAIRYEAERVKRNAARAKLIAEGEIKA